MPAAVHEVEASNAYHEFDNAGKLASAEVGRFDPRTKRWAREHPLVEFMPI
jgi:hypothetical protein